jgi:hypothetical protein
MASAASLPLKSIGFASAILLAAGGSRIQFRDLLVRTFTGPGRNSRIAVIALVLANVKNLPFVWTVRVFKAIVQHCIVNKRVLPLDIAPSTLFLPVITSSYSPLTECDYNLHKSNSTYFTDLDVTRSHLVCMLLQPAITKLHRNGATGLVLDPAGKPVRGLFKIMLGSVQCSFKREIGMYQGYEMWSRFLCWDRKWLYVVTHFVKKGTVRPRSYVLTDGSWFGRTAYSVAGDGHAGSEDLDEKNIFASSISKYVVKLGKLTVRPEVMLEASGMLPERPGGWAMTSEESGESTPETLDVELDGAAATGSGATGREWDWKKVVAENQKGLKFAHHLAALDGLHHEFSGSRAAALGRYTDLPI